MKIHAGRASAAAALCTKVLISRMVSLDFFCRMKLNWMRSSGDGLRLVNGGNALVETPLMRALDARSDATVAQFAQAVGALYYSVWEAGSDETK